MGETVETLVATAMVTNLILVLVLHIAALPFSNADSVQTVRTHTHLCLDCGMIEGTGYLTLQICGTSCCLSRSLDNDNINWIPGQTDSFTGPENLLECANYEVGSSPFYVTAFHDGVDGLRLDYLEVLFTSGATIRCDIRDEMDDHEFLKLKCS